MNDELTKQVKLVLVDDDIDLLYLMSIKLKREGYAVNISHNGVKLHDIIRAEHPDVILLDIQMKGINGGDICKKLKAEDETREIPVVLISANHNIKDVATCCGADGFFSKPVDVSLLKEEIKTVMLKH